MISNHLVMAFDFGLKRIGIAVGQGITGTANPLTVIPARDGIPDWSTIEQLINEWQPQQLVVGHPINMDATESTMSIRAARFARRLNGRFNLPCETMDERLSSFAAQEFAEGDEPLDAYAAKLILETWFRENPASQDASD